jgi:hypothetical protein
LEAIVDGGWTAGGTTVRKSTGAGTAADRGEASAGVGGTGVGVGVGVGKTLGNSVTAPGTGFEAEPPLGPSTRHTPQANTPISANNSTFGARALRGCARDDSVRDFEAMDPDQTFGSNIDQRSTAVLILFLRATASGRSADTALKLNLGSTSEESIHHQRNQADNHSTPEGGHKSVHDESGLKHAADETQEHRVNNHHEKPEAED